MRRVRNSLFVRLRFSALDLERRSRVPSRLGDLSAIHHFFQWPLFEISVRAQSAISQRSHHLDGLVSHVFACHCNVDLWILLQIWEEPLLFEGDHEPLEAPCHAGCRHVSFSVYSTEL